MAADLTVGGLDEGPALQGTVLVVDDEEAVLRAYCRALERAGFRVIATSDPLAVLDLVAAEKVEVVVSDIDMPQMNGVDLMARLRQAAPDVVRVLITGRGALPTALRAINEGEVFRFLTKPCDIEDLRRIVGEAVLRHAGARGGASSAEQAERRARLLAGLEEAYPGITSVPRHHGSYRLFPERVSETLAAMDCELLTACVRRR
jgi:DNA-binding NtrC family response regulator